MQIAWSSFNRFVDFCDCWEVEFHKYRQSLLFVHYSIHFLGLVIGHVARKVTQKILNELVKEKLLAIINHTYARFLS